jgi:hypothetical protein
MSAVGVVQAFAPRYAQARERFLEAAATAGLPVQSHPHPLPGNEGEALALDVARARRWWDGGGSTPVTSIYDGSSTSAFLTGLMWNAIYGECPQAEFTGVALEYGTVPVMEVIEALRA